MGLIDTVKGWFGGGKAKVQGTVATHSDTIKGGIDKAGSVVDDKTGGKYTGKVSAAQEKSKGLVDGLAGNKSAGGDATGPAASGSGTSGPETSGPETSGPGTSGPETSGPDTNGRAEPPA
jgi:hypothetical protein